MSKTISITVPDKVETFFQKKADALGVSRSRVISNILIDYMEDRQQVKVRKKEEK